jgi:hypothetical protein
MPLTQALASCGRGGCPIEAMKYTSTLLLLVAAALAGCESVQEKGRAADEALERGAKAAVAGIEKGAQAAAKGVRIGVEAAARGVERGAQAVARGADTVADSASVGAPPKPPANRWPPDRSGPAGP